MGSNSTAAFLSSLPLLVSLPTCHCCILPPPSGSHCTPSHPIMSISRSGYLSAIAAIQASGVWQSAVNLSHNRVGGLQ